LYSMGVPPVASPAYSSKVIGTLQQGDRHGYEPVHKAHRPGAGGAVPGCRRRGCALDLYADMANGNGMWSVVSGLLTTGY
jgi:hypothetical protein